MKEHSLSNKIVISILPRKEYSACLRYQDPKWFSFPARGFFWGSRIIFPRAITNIEQLFCQILVENTIYITFNELIVGFQGTFQLWIGLKQILTTYSTLLLWEKKTNLKTAGGALAVTERFPAKLKLDKNTAVNKGNYKIGELIHDLIKKITYGKVGTWQTKEKQEIISLNLNWEIYNKGGSEWGQLTKRQMAKKSTIIDMVQHHQSLYSERTTF